MDLFSRLSTSEHNQLPTKLVSNGHNHTETTIADALPPSTTSNLTAIKENLFISSNDLSLLCPLLLYKLTAPTSDERLECIDRNIIASAWHNDDVDHLHYDEDRSLGKLIALFFFFTNNSNQNLFASMDLQCSINSWH